MPRFVLLRHECPPGFEKPSHWDLMLEMDGLLRTWQLDELPASWAGTLGLTSANASVPAIPLADHRLAYLDYEGPLTGDRGSVRRCDRGTYRVVNVGGADLVVSLHGKRIQGMAQLQGEQLIAGG